MKILILQSNGVHDANKKMRECFCLRRSFIKFGYDCDITGPGHQELNPHEYDVILNIENYGDSWIPDISSVSALKIIWEIDAHCRGMEYFDHLFKRDNYKIMLHSTKEYVKTSRDLWFPNAYDDTLVGVRNIPKTTFVGFCGNPGTAERQSYIKHISDKWNAKIDIFVIGDAMVNAINSYDVHFNKNIGIDINYRNFETIGCGTVLITNFNPVYLELGFENFKNCVFYDSVPSLDSSLRLLAKNETLRTNISNNGLELAKRHTYDERVKYLISVIKENI